MLDLLEAAAKTRTARFAAGSVVFEHLEWGGLSAVSRPEDRRVMFLCRQHVRDLEYPYQRTVEGS